MKDRFRILIIEDSDQDLKLLVRHLQQKGVDFSYDHAANAQQLSTLLATDRPDWNLILADYSLPDIDISDKLHWLLSELPNAPVIMLSGLIGEEKAVDLLHAGVTDFVVKDNLSRLVPAMERTLRNLTEQQARRAAERALQLRNRALEAANNGIVITEVEGDMPVVYVNPAFEQMTGYSSAELLGNNCRCLQREDREQPGLDEIWANLADRRPCQVVVRNYRKDGTLFWNNLSIAPVMDGAGEVTHFVGVQEDITEAVLQQQQLRQSAAVFENALEGMMITDLEGRILDVNHGFVEITGYDPDEVVGKQVSLLSSGRQDKAFYQEMWTSLQEDGRWNGEIWNRRKTGDIYPELLTISLVRDDQGQPSSYVGVFADISQLRESQEALDASQERFALAMRGSNDGVFDWDMATDRIYYSPRWLSMLGYGDDDLGDDISVWENLVHPGDRELAWSMLRDYMAGKRDNFSLEFRMQHKDGHWVDILSRAYLVRDKASTPVRIVGTHVDISERKRNEKERRQLHRQLMQSQKLEALGQLTGGIAHDFNNILACILGFGQLALDRYQELSDEKLKDYLHHMVNSGQRAAELVDQMLLFSRPKPIGEVAALDVAPILKDLSKTLQSVIPSSVEIQLVCEPGVPNIRIDPVQLKQIVMNICINARDAMEGQGNIRLHLAKETFENHECSVCHDRISGSWVVLSIADTGPGIDTADQNRVFDPFYTTKDVGKGTGLGLSVVSGIIRSLKGHILLDSSPGQGTIFNVLFPQYTQIPQDDKKPVSAINYHGNGQKILVVDDEPMIAAYLGEFLETKKFKVQVENDSQRALELITKNFNDFDMLITDQTMPKITGLKLIDCVRKVRPDLPVILCTGYSEKLTEENLQSMENVRLIMKPVESNKLLLEIAQFFDKG